MEDRLKKTVRLDLAQASDLLLVVRTRLSVPGARWLTAMFGQNVLIGSGKTGWVSKTKIATAARTHSHL